MAVRRLLIALCALALLGAFGCVDQFDAPSEYSSQVNLCDPQNAQVYQDKVAACRQQYEADGGCGGVMSFSGTLQDRPLTVEASLTGSRLTVLPQGDGAPPLLDEVEMGGASPYFTFDAKFRSVGGELAPLDGGSRDLTFNGAPNSLPSPLQDDKVLFTLSLASTGTQAFAGSAGGASFVDQSPTDIVGTFSGNFGSDTDKLDGCFHVFPQAINSEASPVN